MKDFQRLLKYLRPNLPLFGVAILAMVASALFETAIGALLVPLIDQFQVTQTVPSTTLFNLQDYIPHDDWFRAWFVISALLLAFTILKGVSSYFSTYLMSKIGQESVLELRRDLYAHLLSQTSSFFERHRTNFLVSRIVTSCAAVENAVSANLRDILREVFLLFAFLSAAFYFNWRLMLGALVMGPVVAVLTSKFSSSLRKLADINLKGNQRLTDTAQETLASHEIVKAYSAEPNEKARFSKFAELIARSNLRAAKIAALSPPTIEVIGIIALGIFFYIGMREINVGNMEASQFAAFLFFLLRSYDPLRKISRAHNEIVKAFAAASDVWEVLDDFEKLPVAENPVRIDDLKKGLAIESLVFSYKAGEKPVLDDVSLDIPKGSTVALVGESGGGKSSLTKLIQRLYDPDSGSIKWDGIDLREIETNSLRGQFAIVTQETVLFNDTIKYNIAYGNPDASDELIRNAAKVAFADEFIEQLPNGYETEVGERGSLLSGGQRQRIAIARAVLVDAPLLILDEATSALDAESEQYVKQALENLMKDRTSVVIAHRLSTIRRADTIFVMENGKIVEQGSHNELFDKDGVYRRLYEIQFTDESKDVDS